jgi:hypothetical protein
MEVKNQYTFALSNQKDINSILSLLNDNFRTRISREELLWYVKKNPFGDSRIYLMLCNESRVVGCYFVTPMEVLSDALICNIGYGSHFAINKNHRNALNFVNFSKFVFNSEILHGSSCLLGPPNKSSFQPHKVLAGWRDFGSLDLLVLRNFESKSNECSQIHQFNLDHENLIRSQSGSFQVCKSVDWLNWRYLNRPNTDYICLEHRSELELLGLVVLKIWVEPDGYKKMHVMDLYASTLDAASKMLKTINYWSYVYNCNEINLWSSREYKYRSVFRVAGYESRDPNAQPLIYRPLTSSSLSPPSKNWTFMYGDADGY